MNVRAIRDLPTNNIHVYIREERADGKTYFQDGVFKEWVEVPMGTEPPVFLVIPEPIAEAVGEALAPRPEFGERHLDDVIKVRDRLLDLVTSAWLAQTRGSA